MNALDRAHLLYNESLTLYLELMRRWINTEHNDKLLRIRTAAYLRFVRRFKAFIEV